MYHSHGDHRKLVSKQLVDGPSMASIVCNLKDGGALPHGSGRRHGYPTPSPPHDLWVEARLWRFTSCIHHFRERGGPSAGAAPLRALSKRKGICHRSRTTTERVSRNCVAVGMGAQNNRKTHICDSDNHQARKRSARHAVRRSSDCTH